MKHRKSTEDEVDMGPDMLGIASRELGECISGTMKKPSIQNPPTTVPNATRKKCAHMEILREHLRKCLERLIIPTREQRSSQINSAQPELATEISQIYTCFSKKPILRDPLTKRTMSFRDRSMPESLLGRRNSHVCYVSTGSLMVLPSRLLGTAQQVSKWMR